MAVSGHNSDNETLIGLSSSIELSFYDDNNNEIEISQSLMSIDIIMERDQSTLNQYPFSYVNATSLGFLDNSYFLQNSFKIKMSNVSVSIELKPLNASIGYLLVFQLGFMPIVNATFSKCSSFKLFCPCKIHLKLFISFFDFKIFAFMNYTSPKYGHFK